MWWIAFIFACIFLYFLQVIQDELLCEEIETFKTSENGRIHLPFHRLQNYTAEVTPETTSNGKSSCLNIATSACMRDMCHYARVSGLHVLEFTMDAALTAVQEERLQEASYVCVIFCAQIDSSSRIIHLTLVVESFILFISLTCCFQKFLIWSPYMW